MTDDVTLLAITPADDTALKNAAKQLEGRNFAARLADYAGVPVSRVLGFLPRAVNRQISGMVRNAVMKALEIAVDTLDEKPPRTPMTGFSSFLAGVTGGVGGLFGFGALAVELPMTTTLMLRAIAEIAQHQGEDLSTLEARLACLEVFAYGAKHNPENVDVGYYAARALISRYTHDVAALALERGGIDASAPVVASFISEIVSRFGLVVSDKAAASAVPVLGALGGATVNMVFMDHFQRIAQGHFTMRRLERIYGSANIRARYNELAARKSDALLR
jgi:EcsC protein family